MKYCNRNLIIITILTLAIGAQAHAADNPSDIDLAGGMEKNTQAGVCAVYLESIKMDKKWSDRAWNLAPRYLAGSPSRTQLAARI